MAKAQSYRGKLLAEKINAFSHHRHDQINDRNLMGFVVVLAIFCCGVALMNLIGSKIASFGPLYAPAGIILWSLTFPATDIIGEVYGKAYAKKIVLAGFIVFVMQALYFEFAIRIPPAPFWPNQEAFELVLGATKRTVFAAAVSYLVTQYADVYIFSWVREKTKGKYLWVRNNVSTFCSQLMANTIFLTIAFWGVFSPEDWWTLFQTNLIARLSLAVLDTPIVYGAVYALRRIYPELK